MIKFAPAKIHVGAVYNVKPREHKETTKFTPIQKELVFDIDANDYDEVRFCPCKGTPAVCTICWGLLENAMQILDTALRTDFGFKDIIWVFSGRRGVHGWVCDQEARQLSAEARSAVASYLAVNRLTQKDISYPSLKRAYEQVLLPYFRELAVKHELLMNEDAMNRIHTSIANSNISNDIKAAFNEEACLTSEDRWRRLEKILKEHRLLQLIVFQFAYPRLDIQVSKQWNHLLKAPMTVHPSTGMICVPICTVVQGRTGFDPTNAPRIHEVIQEINLITKRSNISVEDALKSSDCCLQPYLQKLKDFAESVAKPGSATLKSSTDPLSW